MVRAEAPRIVPVRVPAKNVDGWFPPGTPIRSLDYAEFERLVDRVKATEVSNKTEARLIAARHSARLEEGILVGRSEMTFTANPSSPAFVPLLPWTPAIIAGKKEVVSLSDGRTAVRVPTSQTSTWSVVINWRQGPNSHETPNFFSIGLPGDGLARLTLDLPNSTAPADGAALSVSVGPSSEVGRKQWIFDGKLDHLDLRLRPTSLRSPMLIGGTSSYTLARASANWRADWTIERPEGSPNRLEIEFDEGLELLSATGPQVRSTHIETKEKRTRLMIRFDTEKSGPTTISLLGITNVPERGVWKIPNARPLESVWTGSRATVKLDSSHVITGYRELAGRRMITKEDNNSTPLLVFATRTPDSVAELTLTPPTADIFAEVRGHIKVDSGKLEARTKIIWHVARGVPHNLKVRVPEGWNVVRIEQPNGLIISDWTSIRQDLGSLLDVTPPSDLQGSGRIELIIDAMYHEPSNPDAWSPPRIVPVDVRVPDETWILETIRGLNTIPTSYQGLAWITAEQPESTGYNNALAWRWIDPQGKLDVELKRDNTNHTWSSEIDVAVTNAKARVQSRISIDIGDDPIHEIGVDTNTSERQVTWSLRDQPEKRVTAIPTTKGWNLNLPEERKGVVELIGIWPERLSNSQIPLVFPSTDTTIDGHINFQWANDVIGSVTTNGGVPLDPKSDGSQKESIHALNVSRYAYAQSSDTFSIRVDPLKRLTPDGLVSMASLTSVLDPMSSRSQHKLILAVQSTQFSLKFQEDFRIESVAVNGLPTNPTFEHDWISVGLGVNGSRRVQVVSIDYSAPLTTEQEIKSTPWPRLNLPMLSRQWDLIVPEGWDADSLTSEWVRSVRETSIGWSALNDLLADLVPGTVPEAIRDRLGASEANDRSLAEWLEHWNSRDNPIFVDRVALATSGWSANSRIRSQAGRSMIDRLKDYGLHLRIIGRHVLLTTLIESQSSGVERSLTVADLHGTDGLDRYQTVDHWVTTPALSDLLSTDHPFDPRPGPNWQIVHFICSTANEGNGSTIRLIDLQKTRYSDRLLGLISFLVCSSAYSFLPQRKKLPAIALLTLGVFAWLININTSHLHAIILGVLASVLVRAGISEKMRQVHRAELRSLSRVIITTSLCFLITSLAGAQLSYNNSSILVLFPYEGIPKPGDLPKRVILSVADFNTLTALADVPVGTSQPSIVANKVEHEVVSQTDNSLELISRWDFEVFSPASWGFPISGAVDLKAEIDGKPISINIETGAINAKVFLPAIGNHRFILRRLIAIKSENPSYRSSHVSLPLSSLATFVYPSNATIQGIAIVNRKSDDRSIQLGPVEHVTLAWGPPPQLPPRELQGALLWDAEPAGDRLRVRIQSMDGMPVEVLRLGLERGLILRSIQSTSKLADESITPSEGSVEWVGRFVPTRIDDAPQKRIELEFWRPLTSESGPRRSPVIEFRGVDDIKGMIALRRPSDWSGRLEGSTKQANVPDFEFVKTWGSLPNDNLTLAGVVRFQSRADASTTLQPAPSRHIARTEWEMHVERGRVETLLDSKITTLTGQSYTIDMTIDPRLKLTQIESKGLTYWSRPWPDRLELRFDAGSTLEKQIRVRGWITLEENRIRLAWPKIDGATENLGNLRIVSEFPVMLEGTGLQIESKDKYKFSDFDQSFDLRWATPPTKANVFSRSMLRIEPKTMEWIAVLDYHFLDGPGEQINLQLPNLWMNELRATIDGIPCRIEPLRSAPSSLRLVRPQQQLWSNARVMLRGRIPRRPGEIVLFPEIVPLGTGSHRAMVGIVNLSGEELLKAESIGLQEVDPSKFVGEESNPMFDVEQAWVVLPEKSWSLEVGTETNSSAQNEIEVDWMDIQLLIDAQSHSRQRVSYWLKPGSHGLLALDFPDEHKPIVAMLDGEPVALSSDSSGRILARINGSYAKRLDVISDSAEPNLRIPEPFDLHEPQRNYRFYHPKMTAITSPVDPAGTSSLQSAEIHYLSRTIESLCTLKDDRKDQKLLLEGYVQRLRILIALNVTISVESTREIERAKSTLKATGLQEYANLLDPSDLNPATRVALIGKLRSEPLEALPRFGVATELLIPEGSQTEPRMIFSSTARSTQSQQIHPLVFVALSISFILILQFASKQNSGGFLIFFLLLASAVVLVFFRLNPLLAVAGWICLLSGRLIKK